MAWWYTAIAGGFMLLAVDHLLIGDRVWLVCIRLIIALGFGFLASLEFKAKKRNR
jgi:hypothetical protein